MAMFRSVKSTKIFNLENFRLYGSHYIAMIYNSYFKVMVVVYTIH